MNRKHRSQERVGGIKEAFVMVRVTHTVSCNPPMSHETNTVRDETKGFK